MAHTFRSVVSKSLQALIRLVYYLCGRVPVKDLESGNVVSVANVPCPRVKDEDVSKAPVPTFKPDLLGVPTLILSSMAASVAVVPNVPIGVKTVMFPLGPLIPTIIVHPPADDVEVVCTAAAPSKQPTEVKPARAPFAPLTNINKRIYGKAPSPRKPHAKERENLREHPNAPCRQQPRPVPPRSQIQVVSLVTAAVPAVPTILVSAPSTSPDVIPPPILVELVENDKPGSLNWEVQKARSLQAAREFSEKVKERRRHSLPTPPLRYTPPSVTLARRATAPARLTLQERLQRAVAGCVPPTAPAVPVAPLWGDVNLTFVVDDDAEEPAGNGETLPIREERAAPGVCNDGIPASISISSSSSSITSILDAMEDVIHSPMFRGLQRIVEFETGGRGSGQGEQDGDGDSDQWSDVVPIEDYF